MINLKNTSYLFGSNAVFIEELYKKYIENPASVGEEWVEYFSAMNESAEDVLKSVHGAPWQPHSNKIIGVKDKNAEADKAAAKASPMDINYLKDAVRVNSILNAFRTYGHLGVQLDPLGLSNPKYHSELDYKTFGFSEEDLSKEVYLGGIFGVEKATLMDFLYHVQQVYSSRIAAEYMHIESTEEREWIQAKLEMTAGKVMLSKEEKLKALEDIMQAEMFENYLHTKFPGTKRFSVEGLENAISALEASITAAADHGVKEVILGMAHRGRLVTLTKVMGKPYHAMFAEFKGELAFPIDLNIPGDVKYHLGGSADKIINGKQVHLSLCPNPSHLEVVNPVVLGKVRAKQDMTNDKDRSTVMGVLLHGDAAFAGQGTVMEALGLSQLEAYKTGGTIHIVTNNQVGFTTNPSDSRSTYYCTNIAKFIEAPIFHVNGDDAEAVVFVSKLAAEYRAKFKKDVVIDVIGYRKYGHNEGDEPLFTQPIMYSVIKDKQTPPTIYSKALIAEGVLSDADFVDMQQNFKATLDVAFEKSQSYKASKADWLEGNWSSLEKAAAYRDEVATGVELEKLKEIGNKLITLPETFNVNAKIARQFEARQKMLDTGADLDWATGEILAYGSLLEEGFNIRMTGQDVQRGTFSHRHAVLTDQVSQEKYCALNNLSAEQKSKIEIYNSNLSEFGVMGFEYGYSFTDPMALTIWEAQFGDFANGAQVIIDQYVSSAESKWLRMCNLVLLLPHGYEGQGPEHSSARLERFLQLCARDNMQVANCTTPASLFHILRRQMKRNFRKPLVIMSPKSLLRHKLAVSSLDEMAEGTTFKPVIGETEALVANDKVTKLIICTGKVYYDILERRRSLGINDAAIVRLEQIYPFPNKSLQQELDKYPNAEVIWCQEEHENMGAYYFVSFRVDRMLAQMNRKQEKIKYIGRERSSSPAVGYMKLHSAELEKFLSELFK